MSSCVVQKVQLSQREIGNSNEHERRAQTRHFWTCVLPKDGKMFLDLLNAPKKQLDTSLTNFSIFVNFCFSIFVNDFLNFCLGGPHVGPEA